MMHTHLIEPMAPLVFRSGRPFGEGSRDGANFPWPSSLAGMFRTAVMDRDRLLHTARLAEPDFDSLQAMQAAGPFLARRDGDCLTPLLPKPADALYLLPDGGTAVPRIYRLRPGQPVSGTGSTLPNGLALVVLEDNAPKGKPKAGPEFWPLDRLLAWRRGEVVEFDSLSEVKPLTDTRTHVGINRISHAAAVERWQGISGWDLKRWQPKPARKAVATGATYWFEILGSPPAAWVQDLWLTPLSDDVQDRRDGYGLALPGPWCPHTPNT